MIVTYILIAIACMALGAMIWDAICMSLAIRRAKRQLRETLARTAKLRSAEPVEQTPTVLD